MKLLHEKVTHKTYGTGEVVDQSEKYVSVLFLTGDQVHRFIYPDAFGTFLTLNNVKMQTEIVAEVQSRTQADRLVQERHRNEVLSRISQVKKVSTLKSGHTTSLYSENIAFKCNFCDGGSSSDRLGYQGVCSDAVIHNNIKVEHKVWCCSVDCACNKYLNQKISREELEKQCQGDGFICYESQMLTKWRAFAGLVQTGVNKGKPMKLKNIGVNSLCVLTTRLPGSEEAERMIFAVFLVDQSYEGDDVDEGFVMTHSPYKISLTPEESSHMLFWNYHVNTNHPEKPAWSSGLHRYFSDEEAAQILKSIVEIKKGTAEEALANEFLTHFCEEKHLNAEFLPDPAGALTR